MRIGLGRRYGAYLSAFTLASITLTLAAAALISFRQASVLEREVHDAISRVQGVNDEERLRGMAQYLADRMFNPAFLTDVERLDEEVARVRRWIPVSSFLITDTAHRVITDGSEAKLTFGEILGGAWPKADADALLLTADNGRRQVRFAIQSGSTLAGFAEITLASDLSASELQRIDKETSGLWSSHRTSLLALLLVAFVFSLALGGAASAWLSRSLSQPLAEMGRAATAFAQGDLEHPLPTASKDELGELARALRTMSQDVRAHEAALRAETALVRRGEAERSELLADLSRKNAELERFTYTVSHDLKSPLITIRGYLGHLEKSAIEGNLERFREDAGRIDRAASKMAALLRDLLALSRVGRVLKPDEDVPMNAVVQDAADLVRGPLLERRVTLQIEDHLPLVRGDRQRLTEVVQNLIENAVKFMGDQVDARIRIGARLEPSGTVLFVSDNGIGIDARHREKVFDLFEKLSKAAEGTGVGLALVKRIVEAHGGRVWVESEGLGSGSTFCFTLRTPG